MSLLFIIDGYNITNHTLFPRQNKDLADPRLKLLEIIRSGKLTGSPKNKVVIVFDGYPQSDFSRQPDISFEIIFSRKISADQRIKELIDSYASPANTVVVSDDKEIKFYTRSAGAKSLSVQEFISAGKGESISANKGKKHKDKELLKQELSYSQMHQINQELKKKWNIGDS